MGNSELCDLEKAKLKQESPLPLTEAERKALESDARHRETNTKKGADIHSGSGIQVAKKDEKNPGAETAAKLVEVYESTAASVGVGLIPVVGDIMDGFSVVKDLYRGNYFDATVSAVMFAVPLGSASAGKKMMKAVEESPYAKKMIAAIASHPTVKEVGKWFAAKFGKKADEVAEASLVTYIPGSGRKFNQLNQRGWTKESINDLVNNPYTTRESFNQTTGNKATAYFSKDGNYIVRDDITGALVQMSNKNIADWKPDKMIKNPYIPKRGQ